MASIRRYRERNRSLKSPKIERGIVGLLQVAPLFSFAGLLSGSLLARNQLNTHDPELRKVLLDPRKPLDRGSIYRQTRLKTILQF
jgi:hypothetical protein